MENERYRLSSQCEDIYALISWCSGHQGWADNGVPLTLPTAATVGSQECRTPGTKHDTVRSLLSHPCSQEWELTLPKNGNYLTLQDPLLHSLRFHSKNDRKLSLMIIMAASFKTHLLIIFF